MATGKVIWDAGHGGRDPGASSPSGLREKDLTLDVIQRIAGLENGFRGRISFHFTRLTDTDLAPKAHAYSETADLSGRSTFANFVPRDPVREDRLFVSMHFNSEASRTAKGLSVWSYPDSTRGAYLARELLDEVGRQVRPWIGLHGGGLFTADFHVLRETAMPAVLVEAGFVGTQAEADHLAKPLVRQHIAEGAVLAVADIQGERYYFASDNNLDYEHFDLNTQSYATEEELERAFAGTEMAGLGTAFLRAEREHGLHAICFAAHAAWESAWGSSRIAREKHNLFGYGASDSDPYRNAYAFGSKEEGILFVAARVRRDYLNPTGQFHHGSNLRGMNVRYATDQNWRHGIARFWHRIRPFELRFGSGERGPRLEEPAPAPAPPAPAPAPTPTPDPSPTPDPTPTPDPAPVQPPGGFDPEQLKNLIGALKELLRILESILGRTST